MSAAIKELTVQVQDLTPAYEGDFYTILGAGGDLTEWVNGYEAWLKEAEIGKPTEWFKTTGKDLNEFIGKTSNPFDDDLAVLMFPLTGLELGKLALFKLQYEDRWFSDVVDNARRNGR